MLDKTSLCVKNGNKGGVVQQRAVKEKEGKGYRSNEWLAYVKLVQWDLLRKDNNDPGHVAHCFAGCFACDDDTFPDGYGHLDESQERV